jgi:hypothetical protein
VTTTVPESALPRTDGPRIALRDLLRPERMVLLVFAHADCPTARLTLERLAPLGPALANRRVDIAWIVQEPLEVAARLQRRLGLTGPVLAEEAPYEVSRAFGVETVPTGVLLDAGGRETARFVGWSVDELTDILPVPPPGDAPRWKPGCDARTMPGHDGEPALDEFEEMFERGWTDGLPVVPPTPARVEAMLAGRDPGASLGQVPPALGEATLARVAACAVLAGCRPRYFPVVLAATEAMLDPRFNVHGQAVTTSPPGQIVIVNGPVRHEIGLNSGMGALGPGFRANMTIGRAVRLVVHLTGRGVPGGLDRATLGHPGKLGFCIAENEEISPWEPFHVERGFDPTASTVTLLAGDAPVSVSDHGSRAPEDLAAAIGWTGSVGWSPFMWPIDATTLFVIGGEHARRFGEAGWSKREVRDAIHGTVRRPARELRRGETTQRVRDADDDELIPKWTRPENIQIVVAGGEAGRFSAAIGPSLGMDAELITKEVPWST